MAEVAETLEPVPVSGTPAIDLDPAACARVQEIIEAADEQPLPERLLQAAPGYQRRLAKRSSRKRPRPC